jgi:hypothetical protein
LLISHNMLQENWRWRFVRFVTWDSKQQFLDDRWRVKEWRRNNCRNVWRVYNGNRKTNEKNTVQDANSISFITFGRGFLQNCFEWIELTFLIILELHWKVKEKWNWR